jgi:lipopolysaccharide transport system ATP-binding protein
MSDWVIRADNLGKKFRIGTRERYRRFSEELQRQLASLAQSPARYVQKLAGRDSHRADAPADESGSREFWALQNVSFDVERGEVIGIIGRNGAGKSTLLKILSRITPPTTGHAMVRGRIGSLLEVGTGFHPELSGRENIYLNGAILGMKRREIRGKFDEIVEFAEIEQFLDTPVKRYSSGMYMRLAFAVAAHLEPEILVVDEVLAVGDTAFQKKCLGKMGDVARSGRTVLFVSHNLIAVESLTSRVILLEGGKIAFNGRPRQAIARYIEEECDTRTKRWESIEAAPGSDEIRLREITLRVPGHAESPDFDIHSPIEVAFEYWNLVQGARLCPCGTVVNQDGTLVFTTAPLEDAEWRGREFEQGLYRSRFVIPGDLLNNGPHEVHLSFVKDESATVHDFGCLARFDVQDDVELRRGWHGKWPGAVRPAVMWQTEALSGA